LRRIPQPPQSQSPRILGTASAETIRLRGSATDVAEKQYPNSSSSLVTRTRYRLEKKDDVFRPKKRKGEGRLGGTGGGERGKERKKGQAGRRDKQKEGKR
jgi:hypothetical protein